MLMLRGAECAAVAGIPTDADIVSVQPFGLDDDLDLELEAEDGAAVVVGVQRQVVEMGGLEVSLMKTSGSSEKGEE